MHTLQLFVLDVLYFLMTIRGAKIFSICINVQIFVHANILLNTSSIVMG